MRRSGEVSDLPTGSTSSCTSRRFSIPIMLFLLGMVLYHHLIGQLPSAALSWVLFKVGRLAQSCLVWGRLGGSTESLSWLLPHRGVGSRGDAPPMAIFPLFTLLETSDTYPEWPSTWTTSSTGGGHGKPALTMSMGFGCCGRGGGRAYHQISQGRLIAILTNCFVPATAGFPLSYSYPASSFGVGFRLRGSCLAVLGIMLAGVGMTLVSHGC